MKFLSIALTACAVTAVLPFALILSQQAGAASESDSDLDFDAIIGAPAAEPLPLEKAEMRDGTLLTVRRLPSETGPLLILLHGSGWYGAQFDRLGRALEGRAEILAPDLRGHGAAPVRRGDVDYIGQLEDDIADMISIYGTGRRVILAGHSSGGGLAVRFAGGPHGAMIDEAVLIAPFLKYNAPVTRPDSGGWARPLTRRIVGLTMLNAAGITALNDRIAIEFAMPRAVLDGPLGQMATTAYSYRLNASFAPRSDYLADVAALPDFLLIAGAEDQAFVAQGYRPLMSPVTDRGRYELIPGAGHLDVVDRPETAALIAEVLDARG